MVRAGPPGALRDFENIEHPLSGHPLQPVVADLTVQPFQRQAPRVGITRDCFDSGAFQFVQERHVHLT